MAEPMIVMVQRAIIAGGCLLAAACAVPAAFAENLADPTRPSAALDAGSGNPGAGTTDGTSALAASEPVLQSVLIAPGRKVAIISGETVKLGDKFGEARVVRITENEVVLRTDRDQQTLKLFPGLEKRRAPDRAAVKTDNGPQNK
jgi:MSHA biogenesis protein MshK